MRFRMAMSAGCLTALLATMSMVQACSSDAETTQETPDAGETAPDSSTGTTETDSSVPVDPPSDGGGGGNDSGNDAGSKSTMTFFVTSTGSGANGGNLGGLAGADEKCKTLATAKGGGDHTWAAYLSVAGTNAKDRIGPGPWKNQKGKVIASSVAELHGNNFNIVNADVVDENGATVPNAGPNRHDILTGSNADGTAHADTCTNWTSNAAGPDARVGHSDSDGTAQNTDRWNSAHSTPGCRQADLTGVGGEGRFYCFAKD